MTDIELIKLAQKRDRKQEEIEMILYSGKVKNMTYKELFLAWHFGRPIEPLEATDFCKN